MTDAGHDYGKPDTGFRRLKVSLEPDTLDLGVEQTPVDRFFVCSSDEALTVDADTWRLTIDGDAAGERVELSMGDLRELPWVELDAWLECAGNGRRLYEMVGGFERSPLVTDTQWLLGAMGQARWGGVRLADVLALARPTADFAYLGPTGLDIDVEDGDPVRMSLPAEKALDPDTVIAFTMNGEPLIPAHGAPARLIVPGWVGAYSVKWLGHLECSATFLPSWRASTYYRLRRGDGTDLGPATAHPVKSCLALDWPARLTPGPQALTGYARCGTAPIERVEWSLDGGIWHDATILTTPGRWTWAPFRVDVDLAAGAHEISTRATDADGITQPNRVEHHPNTILWNAVTPHPVQVG